MARSKGGAPETDSTLVSKGHPHPLPGCGSSDAAALYSDGHMYCFSCATVFMPDGEEGSHRPAPRGEPRVSEDIQQAIQSGRVKRLDSRGLSSQTCKEWDYLARVSPKGHIEHLAVYRDPHGTPVGVKIRDTGTQEEPEKAFRWVGSSKSNLFGRHKWPAGGKKLIITEGEIDCLTVSQCYSHKYAVVSVPNGAAEAAKAVAHNLEWVSSFDQVVIAFDGDTPGRQAAEEVAKLLPPGKAFIAKWEGGKDPNEMLLAGKAERITWCIHTAEAYRPDGIIDARQLTAQCLNPVVNGLPWAHRFLTEWTYGRRYGEVYTFGAGTGIGKSDEEAEIVASTICGRTRDGEEFTPEACAMFVYESGPVSTKKAVAGKIGERRFHIPADDPDAGWTFEELSSVMARMDTELWDRGGKLFINDSRGAADWDAVKDRCRYLRHAENVRHFFVDPISALVAGDEDERKELDKMVLEASHLSVELDACFYLFSHLTRPSLGPPHEEGGQVQLRQFRGSNGIGMYSHFVIGMERDQQAEKEWERSVTTFRSVKDRYTGNSTGCTHRLIYTRKTGMLDELDPGEAPFA